MGTFGGVVIKPLLYDSLPYKPNDVEYIAAISKSYQVIAVPGNAKANTLKEWIAEVKKSDGPAALVCPVLVALFTLWLRIWVTGQD